MALTARLGGRRRARFHRQAFRDVHGSKRFGTSEVPVFSAGRGLACV